MMCTAPGVTRMVRVAKTRLLFGMVGALLLGCSASSGSTGQGTGGNTGGNAATGGVGVIRFGGQVVYAAADHRRTDISYSIGLV
jgi:hypothetical protein